MRIKRGVHHIKRRKNILKRTKGYQFGRKNLISSARTAILHAGVQAYKGRKEKKRVNKALWNVLINNGLKVVNPSYSYSKFMNKLRAQNSQLDRKVLSQLSKENHEIFAKVAEKVMA